MKIYIDAQLQVVRMNNRDIVTESITRGDAVSSGDCDAPERRWNVFDSWYEGY